MQRADLLEKTLMLGKIELRRRRGSQRMRASLTHWTEFEQTPGSSEGQGSLACGSHGVTESDMTEHAAKRQEKESIGYQNFRCFVLIYIQYN